MRLLRARPHIPFGIHLALIRDTPGYHWGPCAAKSDVPSLVDPDTGEFYVDSAAQRGALLANAQLTEVERELRAQINTVFDAGLAPTHLDWHCLADGGRPDILELAMALAQEYGLAARVWLDDGRHRARERRKPVIDNAFVDSLSISLHGKAETCTQMLRDLPRGLSEWAVHPAHGSSQWQAIEPSGWQVRQTDYEFLTSPRARQILGQEVDRPGAAGIDHDQLLCHP